MGMNKLKHDVINRMLSPMSYVVGDVMYDLDKMWNHYANGKLMVEDLEDDSKFPKVNVSEDEGMYLVEIAAAGFSKEEVSLELKESALYIKMEKTKNEVAEDVTRRYIKREISTKSFKRVVKLPSEVDTSGIMCAYNADTGVIECAIPKKNLIGNDTVKIEIE